MYSERWEIRLVTEIERPGERRQGPDWHNQALWWTIRLFPGSQWYELRRTDWIYTYGRRGVTYR
jgi:hypothetical protein